MEEIFCNVSRLGTHLSSVPFVDLFREVKFVAVFLKALKPHMTAGCTSQFKCSLPVTNLLRDCLVFDLV